MKVATKETARRIAAEWNEHNTAYERATAEQRWADVNYHSFVCSAIVMRIGVLTNRKAVDEFYDCIAIALRSR